MAAKLVVDIVVNAVNAQADMAKAAGGVGKFSSAMGKLVPAATIAATAIAGVAAATIASASRAQQAMGGLDAVFGKNSAVVKGWASSAATSVGLSASAYAEFAAQVGSQLKNMGVPMSQVAGQTDGLIKLGADLAATYGGTTADAVSALSAALRGEADPAERYGLALNQTAVNAAMAAAGTDKLTGAAKTQAKAQTILTMATQQAGGAVGQFARESDTAAGSAQIAAAQWENAKAAIGTAFLPVVAQAATALAGLGKIATDNARAVQILMGVVGGLAAAILVLNGAISVYRTIVTVIPALQKAWAAAQWALNVAMSANPIGIIIIAIVALVAAIVIAYKKSATFRAIVQAVWAGIKVGVTAAVAAVKRFVAVIVEVATAVGVWFAGAWATVQTVVAVAVSIISGHIRKIIGVVVAVARFIGAPFVLAFKVAQLAAQLFAAIAGLAIRVLVALVKSAAAIVTAVWRVAWRAVQTAASAVFGKINAGLNAVRNVVRSVATSVSSIFRTAWSAVKAAASSMASYVSAAIRRVTAPARAAASSIRSAFSSVWSWLRSTASSTASAVISAVRRPIGAAKSAASSIKNAFSSAFSSLRSAASGLGSALSAPFRAIAGASSGAVSAVRNLIGWLNRIHVPSIKIPKGATASSASAGAPVAARTAPRVTGLGVGARSAPQATTNAAPTIIIQGALDPEAVARQIRQIMQGANVRRRGVVAPLRTA